MLGELDAERGSLRVQEIHSFVVLAEELHFARAAERLSLTPGGLSRRIARLEKALGAMLLHRTTRSVGLTPYGMRFAPAARRLMAQFDALPGAPVRTTGATRAAGHRLGSRD